MNGTTSLEAYLWNRHLRAPGGGSNDVDANEPTSRELRLAARDGFSLAATLWSPCPSEDVTGGVNAGSARQAGTCVVIASATGVRRAYYASFARFLAGRGFAVLTFDYRGIGGSRPTAFHAERTGAEMTMRHWGERDLDGVIAWAAERFERVALLGHSVGGQLVAFLENAPRLSALVLVASQSGDYRLWPLPSRLAMAALWYGIVPGIAHTLGYLPGSLGIGHDLPRGVALEWARWCRTPGYVAATEPALRDGYAQVRASMLAFGFDDDGYAPPAAIGALLRLYENADVARRQVARAEAAVGHFGFFRPRFEPTLWTEAATFLERHAR